jgi:hypothetical protein
MRFFTSPIINNTSPITLVPEHPDHWSGGSRVRLPYSPPSPSVAPIHRGEGGFENQGVKNNKLLFYLALVATWLQHII